MMRDAAAREHGGRLVGRAGPTGRKAFAQRLADDVLAWNGRDSWAVALFGDLGSGKTSIKNLMVAALKRRRTKIPILVFNPWQLSGRGGISEGFFNELRIVVGAKLQAPDQAKQRARERLEKYSKRLSFGGTLAKVIAPILTPLGGADEALQLSWQLKD